jgi:hypothetical protein
MSWSRARSSVALEVPVDLRQMEPGDVGGAGPVAGGGDATSTGPSTLARRLRRYFLAADPVAPGSPSTETEVGGRLSGLHEAVWLLNLLE